MKKYSSVISILILCFVAYWSYCDLMPSQNYKHISYRLADEPDLSIRIVSVAETYSGDNLLF